MLNCSFLSVLCLSQASFVSNIFMATSSSARRSDWNDQTYVHVCMSVVWEGFGGLFVVLESLFCTTSQTCTTYARLTPREHKPLKCTSQISAPYTHGTHTRVHIRTHTVAHKGKDTSLLVTGPVPLVRFSQVST